MITATIKELTRWQDWYDEVKPTDNPNVVQIRSGDRRGWAILENEQIQMYFLYDEVKHTNNPKVLMVRRYNKWGIVRACDGLSLCGGYDNIMSTADPKVLVATLGKEIFEITWPE